MIARLRSSFAQEKEVIPGLMGAVTLLSLPNLIPVFWPGFSTVQAENFWLGVGLILLPCVFSLPVRAALFLWVPAAALVPALVVYHLASGNVLREWALVVFMETNASELQRFAAHAAVAGLLAIPAGWGYWLFVKRQVVPGKRLGWLSRLVVVVLILACLQITANRYGGQMKREGCLIQLSGTFPVGPLVAAARAVQIRQGMDRRRSLDQKVNVTPAAVLPAAAREIFVLVIGESARCASFQLHGYARETNPLLMKTTGLTSFQDVLAPATVTLMSVPLLLTPARAPWLGRASELPSVISVFKKAGYHTAWYSSQRKHGRFDTASSIFAGDADDARFLSGVFAPGTGDYASVYDGALIQPVTELIAQGHQRQLIVLHTMGSHQHYGDRYPVEFNHFPSYPAVCRGNLLAGRFDAEQIRNLTNAYDNSIRYTDWVLAELIATLEATHAVSALYYIADHGENAGDAPVLPFAHGNLSRDVLQVPMMVWLSPEYAQQRPAQARAVRAHANAPLSGDCTFHSLVDLAALETPLLDRRRSVASDQLQAGPRQLRDMEGRLVEFAELPAR